VILQEVFRGATKNMHPQTYVLRPALHCVPLMLLSFTSDTTQLAKLCSVLWQCRKHSGL